MNDKDKEIFYRLCYKHILQKQSRLREGFTTLLFLHDVITSENQEKLKEGTWELVKIVKDIPNFHKKEIILRCLKDDEELFAVFSESWNPPPSPLLVPQRAALTTNNDNIDNFYQLLKSKALHAGELGWKADFNKWTKCLSAQLQREKPGLDKRMIADCLFSLLDLTAVLEKQHKGNKSELWKSPVFDQMQSVIGETSNCSLSRLIFQSRKGTAYAQDCRKEALDYADILLQDVALFSRGEKLGSIVFALVNIYIQHYSVLCREYEQCGREQVNTAALAQKEIIMHWIEIGYSHFSDESDNVRKTWRRVYLDKKIYCHLGIDILSRDIQGALISEDDINEAEKLLQEMQTLCVGMERLRLVHFYIAEAKLLKLGGKTHAATGYYKQALDLALEGTFESETLVLNGLIGGNDRSDQMNEAVYPRCSTQNLVAIEQTEHGFALLDEEATEAPDSDRQSTDDDLEAQTPDNSQQREGKYTVERACQALGEQFGISLNVIA